MNTEQQKAILEYCRNGLNGHIIPDCEMISRIARNQDFDLAFGFILEKIFETEENIARLKKLLEGIL